MTTTMEENDFVVTLEKDCGMFAGFVLKPVISV